MLSSRSKHAGEFAGVTGWSGKCFVFFCAMSCTLFVSVSSPSDGGKFAIKRNLGALRGRYS